MNELTDTQNVLLSAFGQIPDEFKPIVMLVVVGVIFGGYYLWATNNGLISCIKKTISKSNKNEINTNNSNCNTIVSSIKQNIDNITLSYNTIRSEINDLKNELLKARTNIDHLNKAHESIVSSVNSMKDMIDLIYKQISDILIKTQNCVNKNDIYDIYKDVSNIKLLITQINNLIVEIRIESSKNTDGIISLNNKIQTIENSLTVTSKNSFR